MKNLVKCLCFFVCLGFGSVAMANDATTRIGVLDWQLLLSKSPQAEDASKRLEKEFQGPKEKFINKQKEFQVRREKMQRDADVMSVAERGKKEKELVKMEQDLRRMDEELRSEYTTRHQEEMSNFIKEVKDVLDKVADEEKYDLVLSQEAALYVAERIDITAKVLEKLEKKSKSSSTKSSDKKAAAKKEADDLKSEEKS